jgi:hypothetical protein
VPEQLVGAVDQVDFQGGPLRQPYAIGGDSIKEVTIDGVALVSANEPVRARQGPPSNEVAAVRRYLTDVRISTRTHALTNILAAKIELWGGPRRGCS